MIFWGLTLPSFPNLVYHFVADTFIILLNLTCDEHMKMVADLLTPSQVQYKIQVRYKEILLIENFSVNSY